MSARSFDCGSGLLTANVWRFYGLQRQSVQFAVRRPLPQPVAIILTRSLNEYRTTITRLVC